MSDLVVAAISLAIILASLPVAIWLDERAKKKEYQR